MEKSDSRSEWSREAEKTSSSKWRRGWSYLRQYSGVSGKSLYEDTTNEETTRSSNVVDEYEELRNKLENNFNEKAKNYMNWINIWKNKEIQQKMNIIEEMVNKLKALKNNLRDKIPKELSEEVIDEAISKELKESNELKCAYNKIQENKEHNILQKRRLMRSKDLKVRRDLKGILFDRWIDVEIQLEKYKSYILSKEVDEKLSYKWKEIPYLRDFPLEQVWRLCVDEQYQKDHGPEFPVEDEPPFLAGTKRLMNAMLNGVCIDGLNFDGHSAKGLTADYYKKLHDIAVEGIYQEVKERAQKRKFEPGYAHQQITRFPCTFASGYVTLEGRKELQEKIDCKKGGQNTDARYGEAGHPVGNSCDYIEWNYKYNTKCMTREERLEIADTIINKYHEEITSAKEHNDGDEKLTAIVRCCQDLYQAHLFPDGNTRTIVAGVLPKLLLENGFRPSILHNSKILAGFSVEEIKDAIRKGQETFQSWCEQTREKSPKGYKDWLEKGFFATLHAASDIKSVGSLPQWQTWSRPELSRFKVMAITRDWYERLYQKRASSLASATSLEAGPEILGAQALNESTRENGEGSS